MSERNQGMGAALCILVAAVVPSCRDTPDGTEKDPVDESKGPTPGDDEQGTDNGGTAGSTSSSTGSSTSGAGRDEECLPTIGATITARLGLCESDGCDEADLLPWSVAGAETGTLVANCTVASAPPSVAAGGKRWILDACSGDALAEDGRLAIDWGTSPTVELSLPPGGSAVSVEMRRPRPAAKSWVLRDDEGNLIALAVSGTRPPDSDFSSPLTIDTASTICEASATPCGGERLVHDVRIDDGAGESATLMWGEAGTVGQDPRYDALVRTALSIPYEPCGEFSDGGDFDLVVVRQ